MQPAGLAIYHLSPQPIPQVVSLLLPSQLPASGHNQTRPYQQPNPLFTFAYSGFVNGEDPTVLTTATTTATQASSPGNYAITLSGGSALNYSFNYISGTLTITAIPGLAISIPNAFTPNADGINDTWNIANLNTYSQSRLQIFNRYGAPVFNSVGYATLWDGTLKGVKVPDGTYYYIISLTPGDIPVSGFVAVIR